MADSTQSARTTAAIRRRTTDDARPLRAARVSVDRIRIHAANTERDVGDLRELTDSIRIEGVLQAITVQQRGEQIEVVDGRRRLLAARLAGCRTVPVVWQDARPDEEVVAITIATDVHKKPMSGHERRRAVEHLRAAGWSVADIADRFGKATSTVYGWLAESTTASQPVADPDPVATAHAATAARQKLADLAAVLADAVQIGLTENPATPPQELAVRAALATLAELVACGQLDRKARGVLYQLTDQLEELL